MTEAKPKNEPRLMDRIRAVMRLKHASPRTEKAYVGWIKRYIKYHGDNHPATMAEQEVTAYLTHLAVTAKVSASTQNQALAALLCLYRDVLKADLPWLDGLVRAKPRESTPVVLSRSEVRSLLAQMDGVHWLMASILYGSGLRLLECCHLRVKDLDFGRHQLTVRRGKGGYDRVTLFPENLKKDLRQQVALVSRKHREDLANGAGWVLLDEALHRKFPNAGKELVWQWIFPATRP